MARAQLLGNSSAIRDLHSELSFLAQSDAKVLITGESGVGKEIVAQIIHQQSRRHARRLVIVNCAGVPDSLLESELFGHTRGSFTGAHADRRGLLELADGGTVFLDEVGEMSLRMQALLLRFLENGEIQRVGCERYGTKVDVRVISATNRDLVSRVASKDFREDLYYRLNVVHLQLPPLRERPTDIPVLLEHFLGVSREANGVTPPRLSPEALDVLIGYQWPGNVRELRNIVERLIVRRAGRLVVPEDLPPEIVGGGHRRSVTDAPAPGRLKDEILFERMALGGESFWTVVYEPFMARDLTRGELHGIVKRGLETTRGSYRGMVGLFNIPATDYRRMLNFLRKHKCVLPFQEFRCAPLRRSDYAPASRSKDTAAAPCHAG